MTVQHDIFKFVIDALERLKIPYMIAGSMASIAYGRPRMTLDMDLVVDMKEKDANGFAAAFGGEYYVNLDSVLEAIRTKGHFNIIQSEKGVKIDFYVLPDDDFSREEFARRQKGAFDKEAQADFASPEDVVLKKLEWYKMGESQKHLDDIKGILELSGSKLDMPYIDKWAIKIGVQDIWQKLRKGLKV
ncbi:hypothetical protein ACFL5U_03160 [Candidatus Margulisiibacteriota bacterium]